ncbi:hypothetical protein [Bordetella petrii]|uniref:hypothetical protein n=1 Tax=Bordetella petrii TaxID=94624 RepID=UPI001E41F6DF|nr:hypothetical protein [Bordetella petrii]MCD0503299.1 hypothetical protein [Bordetella petrii]
MPKQKVRCCITAASRPRSLFTIEERPNGDLLIAITSAARSREIGGVSTNKQAPIREQRISVHRSTNSPYKITTIKLTRILQDGEEHIAPHITSAIRDQANWAYLFASRRPDLALNEYDASQRDGARWSLGSYNPLRFTLFFSVLVSAPHLRYKSPSGARLNSSTYQFEHFAVTALWTFLAVPSTPSAMTTFNMTLDPTGMPPTVREVMTPNLEGWSDEQMPTFFFAALDILVRDLWAYIPKAFPRPMALYYQSFFRLGYFPSGVADKPVHNTLTKAGRNA